MAEISEVQEVLAIEEFIKPTTEEIIDQDEDLMEPIVETYSRDQEEDVGEEGDEEIEPQSSIPEAIRALETLPRFEMAREDGPQNIRPLDNLARELLGLQISKKSQKTLDSSFIRK
jgi:hypothetical protein